MSHTVPTQHPAVVLRTRYLRLRTVLAVALAVIFALTVAVVVLAASTSGTLASPAARATPLAIRANPSAETGARLDHRGLTPPAPQPAISNYPGRF